MAALGISAAAIVALNLRGEDPLPSAETLKPTPPWWRRGEYLTRVGNCMACHTVQGGAPFAGGRGIETPFGVVYSSNLTPDKATGLGAWTSAEFWRAMHNGRGKDGRLLYPPFRTPATPTSRAKTPTPSLPTCKACRRWRRPTRCMRCAFRTAPRRRWACGGPCSSPGRRGPASRVGTAGTGHRAGA